MNFEKNEFTTQTFIDFLHKKYGKKISGEPFNTSDIAQYLRRGMLPYRYGGNKLSFEKIGGIRIITIL